MKFFILILFIFSLHSADLSEVLEYSKSTEGEALLIYKNHELILEDYHNGYQASQPHLLASGTKTFSGLLLLIAAEQGILGLDQPITDFLPEKKGHQDWDQITFRQLLSLSSGIQGGSVGKVPSYQEALSKAKLNGVPGKKFNYGPVPFQLFGLALQKALEPQKKSVSQFLNEQLLNPLNLKVGSWRGLEEGTPQLPSGAYLLAKEWAKMGHLIMDQGRCESKTILSPQSIQQLITPSTSNPNYALSIWCGKPDIFSIGTANKINWVMAAGLGNQRCYISITKKIVIVRFAKASRKFDDFQFLSLLDQKLNSK
jgi:CubicO group peptidase (beta-lactamase class C family)